MADPALALLEAGMRCLEIGPLHNPRITKHDHDVDYLDHAGTDELRTKYTGHDLPGDLQGVDVVWSGDGPLRDAVTDRVPYDFILASHVIEHIADVIGWLAELASVLRDHGLVSLVIPDKRFCFDVNRGTTELAELVDAYLSRLSAPSYRHIVDFHTKIVAVDTPTAWEQPRSYEGVVRPDVGDPDVFAWELCLRKHDAGEYVDVHCHTFTPASFLDLMARVAKLGLLPFRVAGFQPTARPSLEFYVVLEKLPASFTPEQRRHAAQASIEAARLIPREEAGMVTSATAGDEPGSVVRLMLVSEHEIRIVEAKRRAMARVRTLARWSPARRDHLSGRAEHPPAQALSRVLTQLRLKVPSARLFFARDAVVEVSLEPQYRGAVAMLDLGSTDQTVVAIQEGGWRNFERPMPEVLAACVEMSTGTMVDVGANTGFYSLLAGCLRQDLQIIAVEPYPPIVRLLERNIALNGFNSRIEVVRKALGDSTGIAELFVPSAAHGLIETSATLNAGFKESFESSVQVEVETLDSIVGDRHVGLVKIDVEGSEDRVLDGAKRCLNEHRPFVFLEVLRLANMERIDQLRREIGYLDFPITPGRVVQSSSVAFHPLGLNHFWAPRERLDDVRTIMERAGLEVELGEP